MACVTNLLRYPATEFSYECSYLKLNASDLFSQLNLSSFSFTNVKILVFSISKEFCKIVGETTNLKEGVLILKLTEA